MLKKISYLLLLVLGFVLLIELALQLLNFPFESNTHFSFECTPSTCYKKDSLGLKLLTGSYQITINEGLSYTVTHNKDFQRIVSYKEIADTEKEIDFFGCSFAYGWGIDDSLTLPFLLQSSDTTVKINNYCVPGFGTLQAYIILKKKIDQELIPDVVIINYMNIHEDRNLLTRGFQSNLLPAEGVLNTQEPFFYPKLLDLEGSVNYEYIDIAEVYKPTVGSSHLKLAKLIEQTRINKGNLNLNELKSSIYLIAQLNELCKENNIRLIVAELLHNNVTSPLLIAACDSLGIECVDVSPPNMNDYNNAPYDLHPNAAAHQIYFTKLYSYLKGKESAL
jgi:hypothetical protein